MQVNVSIGNSRAYGLQRAVLIYGEHGSRCNFATVHEVRREESSATPYLGPAVLLTTAFIRDLVRGLGRDGVLEVLPENILARNEFVTAWWVSAAQRVLFFHENSALTELSGRRFATPALVFKIANNQLSVRALMENQRPSRNTVLQHAPFWNVYPDGKVCHGTARMPQEMTLESLPGWEQAFFGSNFSHTIRDEICLHPEGVTGLWKQMAEPLNATFRLEFLKPAGQTLMEFVTHV